MSLLCWLRVMDLWVADLALRPVLSADLTGGQVTYSRLIDIFISGGARFKTLKRGICLETELARTPVRPRRSITGQRAWRRSGLETGLLGTFRFMDLILNKFTIKATW